MAREFVTKSQRFYCVSLEPDICKTPVGPATHAVPYTIKGEFAEATGISQNIGSGGAQVLIHASTVIPRVTGDEAGTAKGVKSNTVSKRVQHDEKSATVTFNGERAVREGDRVFMNDRNTTGKIYQRSGPSSGVTAKVGGRATAAASTAREPIEGRPDNHAVPDSIISTAVELLTPTAFIPAALLKKIPGGGAARAVAENLTSIAGVIREGTSTETPRAMKALSDSTYSAGGIDGGTSRGMPAGMEAKVSPLSQQQPQVTSVGGDSDVVKKELAKLPAHVLSTLRLGNIKIIAVRDTIVEAFPELHNKSPRGWGGKGKTWDDSPGVFNSLRGVVAVATSDKNPTGSKNMILHEVGHAYDFAMGGVSESPSFVAAYEADKSHLSAYFLQAVAAGREETFAESFANFYSKNSSYFSDKPGSLKYWSNLPSAMQTSGD